MPAQPEQRRRNAIPVSVDLRKRVSQHRRSRHNAPLVRGEILTKMKFAHY